MRTEKLKELIKQLKDTSPTKEVKDLMDHFEAYLSLSEKSESSKELVDQSKVECLELATKALASFGLTKEALFNYFENEENFSEEEIKEIDEMRSELISSNKKRKIKLPKMRI